MSQTIAKLVGQRLRSAREDKGLTQEDLADALGISKSQISHFERGANLLTIEHLKKLPRILGRPVNYFLGESSSSRLTPDEDELVSLYRQVPDDLKALCMETAKLYVVEAKKLPPLPDE